jgi:hypothetical protein
MAMTRRRFVTASALGVLGALVGRGLGRVDAAAAGAARVLRPAATGSSATRCARCGSSTHTALSGRCAEADEARRSVQSSARGMRARAGRAREMGSARAGS